MEHLVVSVRVKVILLTRFLYILRIIIVFVSMDLFLKIHAGHVPEPVDLKLDLVL
jgi:hypothetical protein